MIQFFVPGKAEPKGSTKQMRNGAMMNGARWEADARMRTWLARVAAAAAAHPRMPVDQALRVTLLFVLPRKPTVDRLLPSVTPDLDKLIRCVFDALEKAKLVKNDSRIVSVVADKVYQDRNSLIVALHEVGVHVTVAAKP